VRHILIRLKEEPALKTLYTFPEVLSKYPYLAANGFDQRNGVYGIQSEAKRMFETYRQRLVQEEAVVGYLRSLFSVIPLARKLNYQRTSYSFKHLFEDILGIYVSHGACIAAACVSGVPIRRCEKTHAGAYFGIAEEVVEHLEEHLLVHEGRGAMFFTEPFLKQLQKPGAERRLRGPVSPKLRFLILKRDRYRCQLCGIAASDSPDVRLHVDHIVSRANGGTNESSNLHTLCADCNHGKGVHPL